jgi:hypothetical protein
MKILWRKVGGWVWGCAHEILRLLSWICEWVRIGYWHEIYEVRRQENHGYILGWLRYLFAILPLLTLHKWLTVKYQSYSSQELKNTGKLFIYKRVEIWDVLSWVILQGLIIIFILVWPIWVQNSLATVGIVFLCFRLFEIFQSWVSQFILKYEWDPINANRSLLLSIVSYLEIVAIGAIIRFMVSSTVDSIALFTALRYSILATIANPSEKDMFGPILYTQIMFALLFLTTVIQQVVGRIGNGGGKKL